MAETPVEWDGFTSAEIDDGSLAGFRPEEVFMAGAQWAIISACIDHREDFEVIVYPWNVDRILSMLRKKGVQHRCWTAGDYTQISGRFE